MNEQIRDSNHILKLYYLLLFGILLLRSSINFILITSFPSLQNNFYFNELELGLILATFYLMSAISIFFWILIFSKNSQNPVILISSLIWIGGIIGFAFSTSFFEFLLYSAIIGFGIESCSLLLLSLILQAIKLENQGKIISTIFAVKGIGSFIGVLFTFIFSNILNLKWNFIFIVISVISLVWISVLSILIRTLAKNKNDKIKDLKTTGFYLNFELVKKTFKRKGNKTILLMSLYIYPAVFIYNIWIQIYFQKIHNLSQFEASLLFLTIFGIQFMGFMIGGFLYDFFYSKTNYNKLYISAMSLLIAAPVLLIGFLIPWKKSSIQDSNNIFIVIFKLINQSLINFPMLISIILIFIGSFFYAIMFPILLILINDCNRSEEKSVMLGMNNVLEILGYTTAALVGGLITVLFSLEMVMLLIPIIMLWTSFHMVLKKKVLHIECIATYQE